MLNNDLIAKWAKNVTNQSSQPDNNSGQKPVWRGGEKSEGFKRLASTLSKKSSTCDSNERKSRPVTSLLWQ